MTELIPTSGQAYAYRLLDKWTEIGELAEQFRTNMLSGRIDLEITDLYFAKITRFWVELVPKVDGRAEFSDMSKEFMEYRTFYYDPGKLKEEGNEDAVFKLEELLRRVIEKLKITTFEERK